MQPPHPPSAPAGAAAGLPPVDEQGGLPTRAQLAFLTRLAQLLHGYGTPAHRLDETVIRCAASFGAAAEVFSTPTLLMAAFGRGADQRTHMLATCARDVDLGALIALDRVRDEVESGALEPDAGRARLERIAAAPPRYGSFASIPSYGLASAGAATLFGGGWPEIGLSLLLGMLCGVVALLTGRRASATRLFEPAAAFLVAFLASAAARVAQPLSPSLVTLSALIVLVPGLSLTLGLTEMTTRHLMSGTTRLAGAFTVFVTIALGVAFGRELAAVLLAPQLTTKVAPALPTWTAWPAVALSMLAFQVLFRARPRDAGWILAAGLLAFAGARAGALFLGPELGGFLGALAIGLGSNLYAHFKDRPASVPLLPGILMLVPGSIGYRAFDFFLADDVLSGMQAAFRTTLVGASLVGGLLVAGALFTPRRVL